MNIYLIWLALSISLSASASAQGDRRSDATAPPGGQVESVLPNNSTSVAQINAPPQTVSTQSDDRDANRRATAVQVVQTPKNIAAQPQITFEGRGVGGSPQLQRNTPSAVAPPSPATRSDGRRTEIVRLVGHDRCDPQAATAGDARCSNVIETRSAEYQSLRPPVLSPEQRLLLDQERGELRGVRAAAQRVARNEIDPAALETQMLAAISLIRPAAEGDPTVLNPVVPSAVDTIVQIIDATQSTAPKP